MGVSDAELNDVYSTRTTNERIADWNQHLIQKSLKVKQEAAQMREREEKEKRLEDVRSIRLEYIFIY